MRIQKLEGGEGLGIIFSWEGLIGVTFIIGPWVIVIGIENTK